jgi:hypothetical protein
MTRAAPPLRRFWAGWTDQSMPRAAPSVWPMPYHQCVADVDWEGANAGQRRRILAERARLASGNKSG